MKYVPFRLLALVCTISFTSLFCQGAQLTVTAPAQVAAGGGVFTVDVSVDSVADLAGYQVQFRFLQNDTPSGGFAAASSTEGTILENQPTLDCTLPDGRFSLLDSGSAAGSGTLCTLTFQYGPQLAGAFTIQAYRVMLPRPDGTLISYQTDSPVILIGEGDGSGVSQQSPVARCS